MAPRLSICIPTYNRADYLDRVLAHLFDEQPVDCDFEVVVSDNASSDRTPEVLAAWSARQPRLRTWRQGSNVGAPNNIQCTYRLAQGTYAAYLADDDRFVPGRVEETLRILDAQPELAAVHAPWEIVEESSGRQYQRQFEVAEDRYFGRANALDLFNFILLDHVFPEICIYRTSAVQRIAMVPFKAYWAFAHLADILDHGDVAFVGRPFYRSLVSLYDQTPRRTVGWDEIVDNLDGYQAGLEYLAVKCFALAGDPEVRQPDIVRQLIAQFIDRRLSGAADVLRMNRNWRGAYEYLIRLRARGAVPGAESERVDGELQLRSRAAIQAFVDIFVAMSALGGVAVTGFADPVAAVDRIHDQLADVDVCVLGPDPAVGIADPARMLVLAGPLADRAALVAAGYLTGLILSEADLLRQFQL